MPETVTDRPVVRYTLSDGSEAVIDPISDRSSLICRMIDGECVWGQAFAKDTAPEHYDQVSEVVADMKANPRGFRRWWVTEPPDPEL